MKDPRQAYFGFDPKREHPYTHTYGYPACRLIFDEKKNLLTVNRAGSRSEDKAARIAIAQDSELFRLIRVSPADPRPTPSGKITFRQRVLIEVRIQSNVMYILS